MTQVAAESLSLPVEKVRCELGDSRFPDAPLSGGSTTSGSVGNAVAQACSAMLMKLFKTASSDAKSPLKGADPDQMVAENGTVFLKDKPEIKESFSAIISRTPNGVLEAKINAKLGDEEKNYSMSTFGAQFAEVRVDHDLGRIHVSRFAGAYDAGRILNHKTARSQVLGGITFGIGMALMEDTWMDHNLGRIVNSDLAEYHVPVHPDIGSIDVHFVEPEDPHVNVIGVKGIGELGITGVAAAIANAVYNATGIRVRDLPITLDKILV
jgi:xanthine dehydrogenase YagR molybdenum-binding subunit